MRNFPNHNKKMKLVNEMYVLDLEDYTWRKLFQSNIPDSRENPLLFVNESEKMLFLSGGTNNKHTFSIENLYFCDLSKIIELLKATRSAESQEEVKIEWKQIQITKVRT
jgi:N-acetylneuraminic acid mutarotase